VCVCSSRVPLFGIEAPAFPIQSSNLHAEGDVRLSGCVDGDQEVDEV
jgi:hypothetical protein